MTPHVARCAEAVEHDDGWTVPADAYVDLGAVGFDLTRLHAGREGVDSVLMSGVAHRFTPGLKGTWLRRRGRPGIELRWAQRLSSGGGHGREIRSASWSGISVGLGLRSRVRGCPWPIPRPAVRAMRQHSCSAEL